MPFTNSEQLYGVQTAYVSGGYVNVTTGQGVFFSVTTSLASGLATGGPATGIITVYDAVSGNTTPHATGTPMISKLYDFMWVAALSGNQAPDLWQPQPFLSGLNILISGAAGCGVTVSYRLGL